MKILILHRIPYQKICYERGLDHKIHDVTYVGTAAALENIPKSLRCRRIERPGLNSAADEVLKLAPLHGFDKYDRVLSLSEYELMDAAKIRDTLHIPGPRCEDVVLVRDKVLMKRAVEEAGLRVPGHLGLGSGSQTPTWTGKTVLKPRDGASSENVLVFDEPADALTFIQKGAVGITNFDPAAYELEEFVTGPILHIDGLVRAGKIVVWLPSQYIGTCLRYAEGQPLGSVQMSRSEHLENWVDRALRAVRISNGSFHLEAIVTEDGLVFLEVANRVGGADVVDTFELATGVYLPAAELASVTGDTHLYNVANEIKVSDLVYGWFVFPGHHLGGGRALIQGLVEDQNAEPFLRLTRLDGQLLPKKITYQASEVPVSGIAFGRSPSELNCWMKALFAKVEISAEAEAVQEVPCLA